MAIATDGYVSRTVKKALIIAVAGYLNYGNTPPPIPTSDGGASNVAERKPYDDYGVLKYNMDVDDANLISMFKIYIEWL